MEKIMGYYGRYTQTQRTRQNNPELVARIEKVAARGVTTLTDWERNFLGSLLDSAKKWGRLTAKQHEVYQRIEKKSDPAFQKARKDWDAKYTAEMRASAIFAAGYYKRNPPYFDQVAERILTDEKFIPSEKLYRKMVENKYVQRAMDNASRPPLFAPGSMAMVRNSRSVAGSIARHRGELVMVLSVEDDVRSATKGARGLTVLPVGSTETISTEERYLKNAKV
jgi:hypothetical protein